MTKGCTRSRSRTPGCRLSIDWLSPMAKGAKLNDTDPYAFSQLITDFDLHLFSEGRLYRAYNLLGAHCLSLDGIAGVRFIVWAPNAKRVSVVGDFNNWDGRRHQMRNRGVSGLWNFSFPIFRKALSTNTKFDPTMVTRRFSRPIRMRLRPNFGRKQAPSCAISHIISGRIRPG